MLQSVHIENIAVIKSADIDFEPGFTVLTGETGAGKSIIIDSINLLLGARVSRELIRTGESSASVSAIFSDIGEETAARLNEISVGPDEDGCIFIQRTLSSDGRAQTKINGRSYPVSVLREAAIPLINIYGQHENQSLLDPPSHLGYLDKYADDEGELSDYRAAFSEMSELKRRLSALNRDEREKNRLTEMLQFQIADIDSAKLKAREDEELEAKRRRVMNIEKLKKQVNIVYHSLYRSDKSISACDSIDRACTALRQLSDALPDSDAIIEKLESYRYELEDVAVTAHNLIDADIDDPTAELDRIETRLDQLQKLKRKYGATVEDIMASREKAQKELDAIESSDEEAAELEKQLRKAADKVNTAAAILTEKRRKAAQSLGALITGELAFLDMDKSRFEVAVRDAEQTSIGADDVEFMISTNPGEPVKPLAKIASGGELSRVMLAIKSVLAEKENTGTLIFDEVDTGVSGRTSHRIGLKLRATASTAQVLCVTHSAQIAALAQNHYFISKRENMGRTETTVTPLDHEGRIAELARIMGGAEITETLTATAREMLDAGEKGWFSSPQ